MTTDITELAQREKFEAWFKSSFHPDKTGPYIKDQLYFAWKAAGAELVEALEYYKSREERVTSLVRDNSKSWDELYRQVEAKGKRNVELVEALASEKRICATWRKTAEANSEKLEKAQQQMTESENRVRKQNRHICELFDDNTALRQRIAGLESRTVTVKLPDINEYLAEVHDKTLNRAFRLLAEGVRAGDVAAMRAAGIKVEAE